MWAALGPPTRMSTSYSGARWKRCCPYPPSRTRRPRGRPRTARARDPGAPAERQRARGRPPRRRGRCRPTMSAIGRASRPGPRLGRPSHRRRWLPPAGRLRERRCSYRSAHVSRDAVTWTWRTSRLNASRSPSIWPAMRAASMMTSWLPALVDAPREAVGYPAAVSAASSSAPIRCKRCAGRRLARLERGAGSSRVDSRNPSKRGGERAGQTLLPPGHRT